jgi:hypothetical protein
MTEELNRARETSSATSNRLHHPGQILVISAFAMIVFIGLIGTGVDYGLFLIEETQLQNALDAASLAGARALVSGSPPGVVTAEAVGRDYLRLHGYENGIRSTAINFSFPPGAGGVTDTVRINLSRQRSTYFWHVFGIHSVTLAGTASAQTGRGMFDVMFSFDETASMDSEDISQLRAAATAFVNDLQPTTTDPRSTRIGIAQFQGQRRDTGGDCRGTDPPSRCWRDGHVLLDLTADRSRILQVVNGPSAACPSMPVQPPTTLVPRFTAPAGMTTYACPLRSVGGSGTYIKVGFDITFLPGTWNMWSTARGGRPDARKVLVIFTDGITNVTTPSTAIANSLSIDAANAIKPGADGVMNSPVGMVDDVEIFVVGFFDSNESPIANMTPPGCPGRPGDPIPGTRSEMDDMLIAASSSRPSTCDHYYPLADRTGLPDTFRRIAGAIARGRLTQ